MILQALVKYYEDLVQQDKVPTRGWCQAKVSCAIELNEDGTIKAIIPLKHEEQYGDKKVLVSEQCYVPEMVTRSNEVAPQFLCDNAKYFLGIDSKGSTPSILKRFFAAKERHLDILGNAKGEIARAICRFFESWDPQAAADHPMIKDHWKELISGGNIVFSMKGYYAHEDPEIKELWMKQFEREDTCAKWTCLVTGEKTTIMRTHRKIHGVPGAQTSGASLVSFNETAFESYGKTQSYNAPVGAYAEFAYTTALNYLLGNKNCKFNLADSIIVFWAESGNAKYQELFSSIMKPRADNQSELKRIFWNLRAGRKIKLDDITIDPNQIFYLLCLAPSAARIAVRFFYRNSFGSILKNLAEHHKRLEIVKPPYEKREDLSIKNILDETVNQKLTDKKSISKLADNIFNAILYNTPYPHALYSQVMQRIRAENGNVTYGRAAIIKAFLIKNYNWKEGESFVALNVETNDTAYVLGRIFALLEKIQKDSAGSAGINSTISDLYFNSACSRPASVYPHLFKLSKNHLRKIERSSMRKRKYYDKELSTIMEKLEYNGIPNQLNEIDQSKFLTGYYHQKNALYTKKEPIAKENDGNEQ